MTWSSSDMAARTGTQVAPWSWQDLAGPRPGADAAEREAQRLGEIDAAYAKGRAEGEEAGFARARKELATAVAAVRGVVQEVRAARDTWDRSLEENLVALAAAIARQIVGRELQESPDALRDLVRNAISSFPADQAVKVHMHPDDLELLADCEDGASPGEAMAEGREARWIADPDVARGGCVVDGPDRIVDGRVDKALERIYWELTRG